MLLIKFESKFILFLYFTEIYILSCLNQLETKQKLSEIEYRICKRIMPYNGKFSLFHI
jgi:hypothetical protein